MDRIRVYTKIIKLLEDYGDGSFEFETKEVEVLIFWIRELRGINKILNDRIDVLEKNR